MKPRPRRAAAGLPPALLALAFSARAVSAASNAAAVARRGGNLRSHVAKVGKEDPEAISSLTEADIQSITSLNQRALAAANALDEIELECIAEEKRIREQLLPLNNEIVQLRAAMAGNIADRSQARAEAETETQHREQFKMDLQQMREQCNIELAQVTKEREVLTEDVKHAKNMQAIAAECGGSATDSTPALLQEARRSATVAVSRSFTASSSLAMSAAEGTASAQTEAWQQAERRLLRLGQEHGASAEQAWMSMLHTGSAAMRSSVARKAFHEALHRARAAVAAARRGLCNATGTAGAKVPPEYSQQACELASMHPGVEGSARCAAFEVELRRMLTGIVWQLTKTTRNEEEVKRRCQAKDAAEKERAQTSERRQVEASEALSTSMASLSMLTAERDAKLGQMQALNRQIEDQKRKCIERGADLRVEVQDAIALRQGLVPEATDCQVSDWSWTPCSQQCMPEGGRSPGFRDGERSIMVSPSEHGIPCLPLLARLPCGVEPCPTDCEMADWSDWSSCSAPCDGGTQSRSRATVTEPRRGGMVCPPSTDRRTCGVGACDRDCELGDWSMWSTCSRACRFSPTSASGRKVQVKSVTHEPLGMGSCPAPTAPERLRDARCNEELCRDDATCAGEEDVLVVMDGSATANFTAQLSLVRALATHASEGLRVGAVAYGSRAELLAPISNHSVLLKALENAQPPGGSPDLAKGAGMAKNLLISDALIGRSQAEFDPATGAGAGVRAASGAVVAVGDRPRTKTVLMLTDGAPTDFEGAIALSDELRAAGLRLVVGVVDGGSMQTRKQVCGLVGEPCEANVEAVGTWDEMARQPWRFLAALCDHLEFPPPNITNPLELGATGRQDLLSEDDDDDDDS